MARAVKRSDTNFICKRADFQECMVPSVCGDFKCYLVQRGATVYHGTGCTVKGPQILARPNFFANEPTAKSYAERRRQATGCGKVHRFTFKKPVLLLRMDLCSNVRKLTALARKYRRKKVLESFNLAFNCTGAEREQKRPLRYSKNSEVDTTVARFVTQLGFAGFATKKQRLVCSKTLERIKKRGKTVGPECYFHAEMYLREPEEVLMYKK